MAISNFKPEIWSARLQRHLDRVLVYAQPTVSNRDYEGEITQAGDTVHIQKITDPTISTYTPGSNMSPAEAPDGDTLALVVDQFRYFNVGVDSVDRVQANVNLLDAFAQRAGVKMAQAIDSYVSSVQVAASTTNHVGTDATPVTVDASHSGAPGAGGAYTPYQLAVELRRQLASQDAPLDSLWLAITPDIEAEILQDPNYIGSGSEIGAQFVRNGMIGKIAGFDVLRTTGAPTSAGSGGTPVANVKLLAGAGNYATTFANQLTEIIPYTPELRFGDAVKGLEVFGAKVLEPATLAVAHVAS